MLSCESNISCYVICPNLFTTSVASHYPATLRNNWRNRIIFNGFLEIGVSSAFPAASNSCSDRTDGGSGNSNCSFNGRRLSIMKVSASLFAQKQLAMTFFSLPLPLFAFASSRIRMSVTLGEIFALFHRTPSLSF